MNVLVTGAAGYIGSIVTEELIREGNIVFALDNLQQGHREAVNPQAVFIQCDLCDIKRVELIFSQYQQIEAVIHLAAVSTIEHSITDPRRYFQNNVVHSIKFLDIMLNHGVKKLVFSSSSSIYGEPHKLPIEESALTMPVNAYGESKLMFEKILHWYGQAYRLDFISLRYFNVAGASECFGEDHRPETHLIPNVIKVALGQAEHVPIFGTNYPTKDGTCIRDYIHVLDIAKAHILALKHLGLGSANVAYNLGNSTGYSVMEVVEVVKKVTGALIPTAIYPKRIGDPAVLVASSGLARSALEWQPDYPDIESIVASAWQWQKQHPFGYKK